MIIKYYTLFSSFFFCNCTFIEESCQQNRHQRTNQKIWRSHSEMWLFPHTRIKKNQARCTEVLKKKKKFHNVECSFFFFCPSTRSAANSKIPVASDALRRMCFNQPNGHHSMVCISFETLCTVCISSRINLFPTFSGCKTLLSTIGHQSHLNF